MSVREEARVTTRPNEDEIETWHAFYEFWRRMHQYWHDEALEFERLAQGDFVSADTLTLTEPAETAILELIRRQSPPVAPVARLTPPEAADAPELFFHCQTCGRNRPWKLTRPPWKGARCSECFGKEARR